MSPVDLRVVFVCGNSRSGTTMMSKILGGHPDVHAFRELHFFEQCWNPAEPVVELSPGAALDLASRLLAVEATGHRTPSDPAGFVSVADDVLGDRAHTAPGVYAATLAHVLHERGASVACDQTPRNVYFLTELLALFPRSHAVVMIRDPRDVLSSQKNRWKRKQRGVGAMSRRESLRLWAGYHPTTSTRLWNSGVAAGERVEGHPRVTTVRFEDVVADPASVLGPLFEDLGLSYAPSVLEITRVGSSHGPTRGVGLDPAAVGRWRTGTLSDVELAACDRRCSTLMEQYGYELSGARATRSARLGSQMTLAIKLLLAVLLNARRVGDPIQAFKRRFGSP